ncbi:hypothetical protein EZV62_012616 [Acer yangbiense]|uniref:DUF4283 domain-containing protein n=1 Tax=Acer yangbiense TaxID=1000413 RepID=A0A5C7HVV5_9ROSI|nr:hypothetical protein EZV62_012616 [Acer yangbiense]
MDGVRKMSERDQMEEVEKEGKKPLVVRRTLVEMNTEEIARMCASLSLTEREGPVRRLNVELKQAGVQLMSSRLVGKILANKQVNEEVFKSVITKNWQTKKDMEIELISRNTFAFHFSCQEDKIKMLKGGPWSFDDALMVLVEPGGKGDLKSMLFNKANFWVLIQNIPLMCMTKETGKFLGGIIGIVKEIDGRKSSVCMGKFLRVKVEIELDKPL